MFYVRGNGVNVAITEENVFTDCPACGCAHRVDLPGIFRGDQDYGCDLMDTRVYCEACSAKRLLGQKVIPFRKGEP